jgi:cytidylate kinase
MPVIALTQEMGSLAKDVALRLAEASGLQVLRHEVLEHVADKMQVPTSLIKRLREGRAGLVERLSTDSQQVAVYTAQEVFARARRGNIVLRGWGATVLLRPVRHVVTVRVTRAFDQRVDWVMDHLGTDDRATAEAEVRRSDAAHAGRMNAQFGVTWGDPLLFDLVLNTDRISIDGCVELIRQLAAQPEFQETASSRERLEDLALEAAVRAALKENAGTQSTEVSIRSAAGRVTLQGIVVSAAESTEAERITTAVAGLGKVDNQLRLMAVTRRFASSKT